MSRRRCSVVAVGLALALSSSCATTETPTTGRFGATPVPFRGGLPGARDRAEEGDLAGAIELAEARLAEDPTDSMGWYTLGTLRATMGDYAAARTALVRCVEIDSSHAAAWNNLGLVEMELGADVNAEAAFRKAAGLRPDDTAPWVNLAALRSRQGLFNDALSAYDEALFREPQDRDLAVAHAGSLVRAGRYLDAFDTLTATLETYGDDVRGLIIQSIALRSLERFAEARQKAERALAAAPGDEAAALTVAIAADMGGDADVETLYKRALAAAEAATDADAADTLLAALYNYGAWLEEAKRLDEAVAIYQRYLERAPPESLPRRNVTVRIDRIKSGETR